MTSLHGRTACVLPLKNLEFLPQQVYQIWLLYAKFEIFGPKRPFYPVLFSFYQDAEFNFMCHKGSLALNWELNSELNWI